MLCSGFMLLVGTFDNVDVSNEHGSSLASLMLQ